MTFRYDSEMPLFNGICTITRHFCLIALLMSFGLITPSRAEPLQEDPGTTQDTGDEQASASNKTSGLLDVARLESLREKEAHVYSDALQRKLYIRFRIASS